MGNDVVEVMNNNEILRIPKLHYTHTIGNNYVDKYIIVKFMGFAPRIEAHEAQPFVKFIFDIINLYLKAYCKGPKKPTAFFL